MFEVSANISKYLEKLLVTVPYRAVGRDETERSIQLMEREKA